MPSFLYGIGCRSCSFHQLPYIVHNTGTDYGITTGGKCLANPRFKYARRSKVNGPSMVENTMFMPENDA
jgi:hypothetical protein